MQTSISTGALAYTNRPITMSSLEIAGLLQLKHYNVCRDIRNVLSQAGIALLKFEYREKYNNNNTRIIYHLPRAECDLVISGYSVKYRWAIIQRWHELEKQAVQKKSSAPIAQPLVLPDPQRDEILTRVSKFLKLFHPFSDQFADALGVIRLLQGNDPVTGNRNPKYVKLIDPNKKQQPVKQEESPRKISRALPSPAKKVKKWDNPKEVEKLFKSMRLRRDVMYTPALITPDQVSRMYHTGDIGPRQWARIESHIVKEVVYE